MSSAPWPLTIQPKTRVFTFLPPSSLRFFPANFRFPSLPLPYPIRQFKSSNFSYNDTAQDQSGEDEDPVIGDCLVFEEGVFDDPFLSTPRPTNLDEKGVRGGGKDVSVSPESLIPDNWLDVQREINITKKERRKLSQQLEYGRSVEKRKQALRPVNSDNYEKFRQQKLQQLKPIVLDNPESKDLEENVKQSKVDNQRHSEGITVTGRVAPRNPRLAVYGVGLEDISALFKSESYEPGSRDKGQAGNRKSFSKEEKLLMNRRVPDLIVATSGKWHPLHSLAACGEFYLVKTLLQHYPDINAPDKDGLTALHKSILGRKQAIFNFLLRESANPFVRDNDGATLMHYAVFAASSQMIKILLLYNVDINLQDNDGWTPLHLAVQSRRTDLVRLLLIKGADKMLKNQDGLTALDLCLYSGRDTSSYELIKLLKRIP